MVLLSLCLSLIFWVCVCTHITILHVKWTHMAKDSHLGHVCPYRCQNCNVYTNTNSDKHKLGKLKHKKVMCAQKNLEYTLPKSLILVRCIHFTCKKHTVRTSINLDKYKLRNSNTNTNSSFFSFSITVPSASDSPFSLPKSPVTSLGAL